MQKTGALRNEVDRRLSAFGVSGAGRDWVIKALDPANGGPCPGIPDTAGVDVVRPEYRVESQIQGPPGSSQWDLFMWMPPGDVNAVAWAAGPSPADFTTLIQGTGAPLMGWTYGSILLQPTIDLPATFGTLRISASNGVQIGAAAASRVPSSRAHSFRHMYKSLTCELSAPDVNNQGQLFVGQVSSRVVSSSYDVTGVLSTAFSTAPPSLWSINDYFRCPLTESDLTLCCPNAYVGKAKDGFYMPLRQGGPVIDFADVNVKWPLVTQATAAISIVTDVGDEACQLPHVPQITNWDNCTPPGTTSPYAVNTAMVQYSTVSTAPFYGIVLNTPGTDTGYDHTNLGVAIWRGLGGPGSGGGSFGATVLVKVLVGLEFIPRPSSIDRIFAKPAAQYDPRAIEAYFAIAMQLQAAYPASYNSFGDILGAIASVAGKVLPILKAIPVVGPIAGAVEGVGRAVIGAFAPSRGPPVQSAPAAEIVMQPQTDRRKSSAKVRVVSKRKIR
jgi:hypothetical protein